MTTGLTNPSWRGPDFRLRSRMDSMLWSQLLLGSGCECFLDRRWDSGSVRRRQPPQFLEPGAALMFSRPAPDFAHIPSYARELTRTVRALPRAFLNDVVDREHSSHANARALTSSVCERGANSRAVHAKSTRMRTCDSRANSISAHSFLPYAQTRTNNAHFLAHP